MKCYNCVRKDYCTYIHQFNHDLNVGCIEFQDKDRDYTTYISNTLNIDGNTNSKELAPLEVSKQLKEFVLEFINNDLDRMFVQGSFDIIEEALKRLEEHDRTFKKYDIDDKWLEPALYVIKNHFPMNTETQLKKLKALEIIKEKSVVPAYILNTKNVEEYNQWLKQITFRKDWLKRRLNQEEYNSLKEVLYCGK